MSESQAPISSFLAAREQLLRASWQDSVDAFSTRLGAFLQDPNLYDEVKGLLVDLLELVERPAGDAPSDETHLQRIVAHLRRIQEREGVGTTEMVFFLFSVKDILEDAAHRASLADPQKHDANWYRQGLKQVSGLLHRLGLVLFESDVRAREDAGFNHDVLAMEYALLYERTRRIAITDQLTGLFNFGYFRERLGEEVARADRYQRLLSLIIFDIDHFKRFNDTNGHPAGNEVLRSFAQILQNNARDVDIAARYGGEEMVVLLPEATRRDATRMAERIREEIAGTEFPGMSSQPEGKITLSAGVATYPVDAATADELVERADASLYSAKNTGRNKVVWYEPPHRETLVYHPGRLIENVALVGSFNNWDKDYDFMYPTANGAYEFVISLNPGIYQYKFVVNGREWIPDPACVERAHDGLGGDNSVLRVPRQS
jgi:diguanylate cyclase (GGDEF)-like protein